MSRFDWKYRARPKVGWRDKYPQEDAEDYFKRVQQRREQDGRELWLQLSMQEDHVLKSIAGYTAAELAARNERGGLDNFNSGYTLGPYTVGEFKQNPGSFFARTYAFDHAVFDRETRAVISGTKEECERIAEEMNMHYAKSIMVKP